jgi:hypothetical protein
VEISTGAYRGRTGWRYSVDYWHYPRGVVLWGSGSGTRWIAGGGSKVPAQKAGQLYRTFIVGDRLPPVEVFCRRLAEL